MQLPIYQVDAFTDTVFTGNPAAVIPLQAWLPDPLMLNIAAENNLSETAFFIEGDQSIALRWFTPLGEIDLCGHATLATAYVLFEILGREKPALRFSTKSGILTVKKRVNGLEMDFPSRAPVAMELPTAIAAALGVSTVWSGISRDWLVVLNSEASVKAVKPDVTRLFEHTEKNIIITAKGESCDFVSRFFWPGGTGEDPVTGSAHCTLVPYWAERLNKYTFKARQLSERGGSIDCQLHDDRVVLSGQCVHYMSGEIAV